MIIKGNKAILLKGTKIVHVKVSKRSKAHTRKIKVSNKVEVKFDSTNLHVFEDYIRKQDFESCAAFGENGKMIFNKDGEESCISFSEEERLKQKGTVFTHNHPKGFSFSPADIRWSCQARLKEMRCISKTGEKFSMKMKDGSNFNMELWDEKINLTQDAINNQVHEDFMNAINNKEMTIKECNDSHWDTVWRLVIKEIPELEYYWGD